MKSQMVCRFFRDRQGVTLLECIVTLAVLSLFFLGAYQVYSTTYRHVFVRDAHLDLVQDSQHIMSYLARDIRQTDVVLPDYPAIDSYAAVLALKMRPSLSFSSADTIVVYAIDKKHPDHLFRIVQAEGRTSSLELSPHLNALDILPEAEKLMKVTLSLQRTVAGKKSTYHVSSAYAVRL